jgi:hypothetical protein
MSFSSCSLKWVVILVHVGGDLVDVFRQLEICLHEDTLGLLDDAADDRIEDVLDPLEFDNLLGDQDRGRRRRLCGRRRRLSLGGGPIGDTDRRNSKKRH